MIDITVGHNTIEVEMKTYYIDYGNPKHNKEELVRAIIDILDKAKYSGESISLWKATEDDMHKDRIKDW